MDHPDYYQMLGVSQEATAKQIKDAYRELAFQFHPDRNKGDAAAAEKMKQLNEAYAVLSNPRKRGEYDGLRRQYGSDGAYGRFRNQYTEQDIFSGTDFNSIFDELARTFGLRGFDEIFKDLYHTQGRTFQFKRPGLSGKGFFFFGAFGMGGPFALLNAGRLAGFMRPLLGGLGNLLLPKAGRDLFDTIEISPDMAVQGGPYAYYHAWQSKKLVVKIPPGVKHGQKIRLAGMGAPPQEGGKTGDLYLRVVLRRSLLEKIWKKITN